MRVILLLVLIISISALLFLLLSYTSPLYTKRSENIVPKTQDTIAYFQPAVIHSDCNNASVAATIQLDTKNTPVSSAQIELQYNPAYIYNLSIAASDNNLFGNSSNYEVSINEVRPEYGRVSFIINSKSKDILGNNPIADVTFNIYPQVASSSTQIKFLNKSTVTQDKSRNSILSETIPLTILCQK